MAKHTLPDSKRIEEKARSSKKANNLLFCSSLEKNVVGNNNSAEGHLPWDQRLAKSYSQAGWYCKLLAMGVMVRGQIELLYLGSHRR